MLIAKGTATLETDKERYFPGETMKVGLKLELPKPIKARGVAAEITIYKTKKRKGRSTGKSRGSTWTPLFHEKKALAGPGVFTGTTSYSAEFRIPDRSEQKFQQVQPGEKVRCEIIGKLDVAFSIDVSSRKKVSIAAGSGQEDD